MTRFTVTKVEYFWQVIVEHDDGSRNDYRFMSKRKAEQWVRRYKAIISRH